jgi:hypothetical protein
MVDRRVSFAQLADATGRNIKTAQRWVYEGRIPRSEHAQAIARFLDIDANWLWPRVPAEVNPELINLYAHIAEVPQTIWTNTARSAKRIIDVAADTAPVFPHDLSDLLIGRAQSGVQIRFCVAASVLPWGPLPGTWARINPTRHGLGIYRFDDQMLVWLNRTSSGVKKLAPTLHLRQSEENGVFDFYRMMFHATVGGRGSRGEPRRGLVSRDGGGLWVEATGDPPPRFGRSRG